MKNARLALAALFSATALSACTDNKGAQEALTKAGYTDIETTGYKMFACSEDDNFATGFRARNARGQVVEGTVCGAVFKGSTIRY